MKCTRTDHSIIHPTSLLLRSLLSVVATAMIASTACGELVAHWKLDEGGGEIFADSVGGNDGFLPVDSIVDWVQDGPEGIQDVSVFFEGDFGPSYIETPFEGVGGADPRTIAVWVKAEPQTRNTALVAWGATNPGEKWHFRIEDTRIRTEFMGGQNYGGDTDVADGQWHHLVSIFPDGGFEGDDIIHYVDGEIEEQLGGNTGDINTATVDDGGFPVHLGLAIGHPGRWFHGQMADVRIYDEELDQDAILAIMSGEDAAGMRLQPGDANQDLSFDQLDIVQVSIAAKYLTGQPATWGEGDWDGAPGGEPGSPPAGNGLFDQIDIIAALSAGKYLTGPYAAISPNGVLADEQTSLVYDAMTGELSVDAPASTQLTSVFVTSASSAFVGDKPPVLDGPFDSFGPDNIFKSTIGSSFGDISLGNVLPAALSEEAVLSDLSASGSLDGGGGLGDVDLIYIPEPTSVTLVWCVLLPLMFMTRRLV